MKPYIRFLPDTFDLNYDKPVVKFIKNRIRPLVGN